LPAGDTKAKGSNFVDIIMNYVLENSDKSGEKAPDFIDPQTHELLASKNPLLTKTPGLKLAEILAANAELREDVQNFITNPESGLSVQDQILQTLALNQNALDSTIAPLSDGVITTTEIENGSPRLLNALIIQNSEDAKQLLNKLQAAINALQSAAGNQAGSLTLINLTPAQISEMKSKIDALLADKNNIQKIDLGTIIPGTSEEDILAILSDLLKISGAQSNTVSLDALGTKTISPVSYPDTTPLPARVGAPVETNALPTPFNTDTRAAGLSGQNFIGSQNAGNNTGNNTGQQSSNFNNQSSSMNNAGTNQNNLQLVPTAQNLPSLFVDMLGSLDPSLQFTSEESTHFNPLFTITGPGSLTNLTTQAPSASAPHPATQMVAASILKSAGNQGDRNILVQLDPPELGRVEIRLSFNKDKAVKAVVLAERGETVTMLQRDAHVLERALQSIGLNSEGSISFELAGEQDFNQNGRHDGYHGSGSRSGDEFSDDAIDTTMTWYVDMATGHTRYNILA
jgi:hypothetical protein